MKVGLLSDIHCNLAGLQHALGAMDDCDEVLCAGDLLFQYRFANDVLALLARRDVRAISGNHDWTVLRAPAHPLRTSPSVDPRWLEYLRALPERLTLTLAGVRVLMVHGAPWDEPGEMQATYVYPHDERQMLRLGAVDADVLVLGHTHVPMVRQVGRVLAINPGSCGEARVTPGELHYAKLDLDVGRVEIVSFTL